MWQNILKSLVTKLVIPVLVVFFSFSYAYADDECCPTNCGWNFMIAPYAWLTSVNGTLTVKNYSENFNIPFSEILDNFDGGGEVHVEAGYGPLTLMFDPTYLRLKDDVGRGPFDATLTSNIWLVDGGVFYKIASTCFSDGEVLSLELLAGGRYFGINNTLDFDRGFSVSDNSQFLAPIIGGRIKYDVSTRAHLWLRADVGGFDIDNVQNTWSSTAGIGYNITPGFEIGAAYRVLKLDLDTSSNSTVNTYLYGPMVGVSFNF